MSQVLALKYRPTSFEQLIGQESISQTLAQALDQNRLSHAYLFSGLRGSGKTSTARIFAKCLVCDKGPTSTPCGECQNCQMAHQNRHIDIIEMDAASSRKIDDIRGLIEQTKYKPNSAAFKIFIIDEVHMLTKEAFNALLKTLEEPPEYVKFILATTDPMKLPPTILSRTQHFRFKKIAHQAVLKHLSHILNLEEIPFEIDALKILARAGNGSLRDTLTLLDQAIIYSKNYVDAKSIATMLGVLDPEYLSKIFDAILKANKKEVLEFIHELENYEGEVVIDELIFYLKERFFEQDARFSTMLSERFFKILSEAKRLLFLNADTTFVLTLVLFKMIEATKIKEIDEMIETLEQDIAQNTSHTAPQVSSLQTTSPKNTASKTEETQKPTPTPEKEEKTKESHTKTYETLLAKLYDRNYELGECFEKSITFVGFEAQKLTLSSCANDACKKLLRLSSGIIKHFVQESFGLHTKIAMRPCPEPNEAKEPEKKSPQEQIPAQAQEVEEKIQESEEKRDKENENPADSCVANQSVGDTSKNEIDAQNILENPFVKKAGELFEPSKIIVKSKI